MNLNYLTSDQRYTPTHGIVPGSRVRQSAELAPVGGPRQMDAHGATVELVTTAIFFAGKCGNNNSTRPSKPLPMCIG